MRICAIALLLAFGVFGLACSGAPPATSPGADQAGTGASQSPAPPSANTGPAASIAPQAAPSLASAHGGGGGNAAGGQASSEKPDIDTAALDAKITKAEAKAKAGGASSADKQAAAAAYVERANVYYNAGQPRLYKFALGDFRRALRYDPENADAKEKMEMLVSIYQSMGRPIPNNGNEP
jgi:hypothetical protein